MNKISLGVLLSLAALIAMHRGHAAIGTIAFVVGIVLINGRHWPRR